MNIAILSSEVAPFSKTGGLADVSGTLPVALADAKHAVTVVTPLYASIDRAKHGLKMLFGRGEVPGLGGTEVWEGTLGKSITPARVLFIGAAAFDRSGLYQENGRDFADNDERFSFFCRAALALLKRVGFRPDVVHANDWQTALAPVYLKTHYASDEFFSHTGSVFSIHNMAYQGVFEANRWRVFALPDRLFRTDGLEFYGRVNLLKAGIIFSDALTTVSPRYAQEIQTRSNGCGLEGVLSTRKNSLTGILNGIDYDEWNPARSEGIFPPYSPDRLESKSGAKKVLREKTGLPAPKYGDVPVYGVVTRLDPQKGCDILLRALFRLLPKSQMQFVLLGSGSRELETAFSNLAKQFPDKAAVALRFDSALAKLIYAGSDFFVMPSKYEPCGLGQMIAMSYGTVPIVRLTGGLADTVRPVQDQNGGGNGFGFQSYTGDALGATLVKSLQVYQHSGRFQALQQNAMKERFTWNAAAAAYVDVYRRSRENRLKGGDASMAVKTAEKADPVSLLYEVGESAGKVYQYLSKKEEGDTPAQIAKAADLESTMSAMAIGWLARESNVAVERTGKKVVVRLIRR